MTQQLRDSILPLGFETYTLMLTILIAVPLIWKRSFKMYLVSILVNSPIMVRPNTAVAYLALHHNSFILGHNCFIIQNFSSSTRRTYEDKTSYTFQNVARTSASALSLTSKGKTCIVSYDNSKISKQKKGHGPH